MKLLKDKKLVKAITNEDLTAMVSLQLKLKKNSDVKGAIDLYSKLLKKKKKPWFYFYRGLNNAKLNNYEEAVEDYTKVLKYDKNNDGALNNRGIVYFEMRDYARAIKDLTAAIKIAPTEFTYLFRATSYFFLQKYDKAQADWKSAVACAKKNEMILKKRLEKVKKG